jgi:hypothetical protein
MLAGAAAVRCAFSAFFSAFGSAFFSALVCDFFSALATLAACFAAFLSTPP